MTAELETLEALDESVDRAASSHDVPRLDFILADDFRYTHSTGTSQSKAEWIESLRSLAGRRERIASGIQIELHGETAVAAGNLDVVWVDRPTRYYRYVRVYRIEGGRWRLFSQHTFPADDRAPAQQP